MNDIFKEYGKEIYFSDEMRRTYAEKMIEDEFTWRKWIRNEGIIFTHIGFPPTALIDRYHFDCYVTEGQDFFDYEPFESSTLTDKDAFKVLMVLENYITEKFTSWLLLELRERFNISCEFEDNGETWPPIPSELISKYCSA